MHNVTQASYSSGAEQQQDEMKAAANPVKLTVIAMLRWAATA